MSIISTSFPNTAPEPSNPRRIVLSHDPETGAPAIIDNEEPIIHGESGQTFCTAYTQKDFIGRPELALEGASRKPDQGFIQTTGVSAGFIGAFSQEATLVSVESDSVIMWMLVRYRTGSRLQSSFL